MSLATTLDLLPRVPAGPARRHRERHPRARRRRGDARARRARVPRRRGVHARRAIPAPRWQRCSADARRRASARPGALRMQQSCGAIMRCRRDASRSAHRARSRPGMAAAIRSSSTAGDRNRVGHRRRERQQALDDRRRRGARGRPALVRVRAGHAQRAARPVGLRQVDDAAADRGTRARRRRPHPDRRPRRHRPAAGAAQHLDGVPVLRAVSASVGRREHRVRLEGAQGRRRGRRSGGCRASPICSASTDLLDAQAVAALRRPAAARRARPRDHRRGAGVPDGRAAVESRRAAARRRCAARSASCSDSSASRWST